VLRARSSYFKPARSRLLTCVALTATRKLLSSSHDLVNSLGKSYSTLYERNLCARAACPFTTAGFPFAVKTYDVPADAALRVGRATSAPRRPLAYDLSSRGPSVVDRVPSPYSHAALSPCGCPRARSRVRQI
jgi:hypothetical protein